MKQLKRIIFLFLMCGIFFSCSNQPDKTDLEDLLWLEGEWVDNENNYYESWRFSNSSFVGKGLTIDGNDTIFAESLMIIKENEDILYLAQINDQNEGKPVPFRLNTADALDLIFENKDHDFPNIIRYQLVDESTLKIKVTNTDDSKGFELLMKK